MTLSRYRDIIASEAIGGLYNAGIVKVLWHHNSYVLSTGETHPPHIHALNGEDMAAIDIQTGKVLEGKLPPKALSMVLEWMNAHKNELLHIWDTQEFKALPPLE